MRDLEFAKGLKAPAAPLLRVGVKAGFEDTGGGGPLLAEACGAPEYLEPDASETFRTIDSGVRSRSDLAVTCTWYPFACKQRQPQELLTLQTYMQDLRDSSQVACKVALCSFWDSFTTPSYKDRLRQRRIRIVDFGECKLDAAVGKLIDQIYQLALYIILAMSSDKTSTADTNPQCFGLLARFLCYPYPVEMHWPKEQRQRIQPTARKLQTWRQHR